LIILRPALALLLALMPAPSFAGWREDMKAFRVGMIAEDGAGQIVPGLSTLRRAYSQALGLPVEIFVARDYASLIEAQAASRVDYAIYSTTAYATAALLCSCVEPVVAPLDADGATGIAAVLITRDGRLPALSEIGRHRVAIPPSDSIAGSMLPSLALAHEKITLTGSEPLLVRAESASAAETMLVDGSVDAIFGWVPVVAEAGLDTSGGTLDRLVAAGLDRSTLTVVWTSQPLRYGPHALRAGLDGELRKSLVIFLTSLRELHPDIYDLVETVHGGGFVEVGQSDYAPAVEMVRQVAREAIRP
jgi:phosphonate transport system substrate-binding protein